MRYLELRRHTLRDPGNPHISQRGLDLARRAGIGMGPFAKVISSPEPRAIETAIALGFAVDSFYEPVQEQFRKKHLQRLEELLPPEMGFDERAVVLQERKLGRKYAAALLGQWTKLARKIPAAKQILVITHGGYLEDSAIACLPAADYRKWGRNFLQCEGIRLSFNRGYFVSGELLRIN